MRPVVAAARHLIRALLVGAAFCAPVVVAAVVRHLVGARVVLHGLVTVAVLLLCGIPAVIAADATARRPGLQTGSRSARDAAGWLVARATAVSTGVLVTGLALSWLRTALTGADLTVRAPDLAALLVVESVVSTLLADASRPDAVASSS